MVSVTDAIQYSDEYCACSCMNRHAIGIRAGSVECRICHKQICYFCCEEVKVSDSDMPEFKCHKANFACKS